MDDDDIVIIENAGPSRPKVPVDPKPIPSGSKRHVGSTPELDDSKSTPAKRRWALLSNHLTKRSRKAAKEVDSLGLYELREMERDEHGKWLKLKWTEGEAYWPSPELRLFECERFDATDLTGFNNTGNIRIWLSEECLAYYLLETAEELKGKSILELGAGMTGLAGLCCARYAHYVTITDGNEKSVNNVSAIIAKNELTNCESICLRWGESESLVQKFDLIIAADCFFHTDGHEPFIDVLEKCLKQDGTVVICAPERAGTLRSFLEKLFERGTFVVDQTANVCDKVVEKISMLTAKDPEFDADKYHLSDEALARICFSIADEIKEEKNMEIDPAAVLRVAGIIKGLLLNKWMPQLEAVSRIAKRQMINEDDVKAIFAHNHQLVGKISPTKLKKKEAKKKSTTSNPKKSNAPDKGCHSNTITQYIRESSTVEAEDGEPGGPTTFEALKKAIEQEKDEQNKSKGNIRDSWSDDSWDEVPPKLGSENPVVTLSTQSVTFKQEDKQETQSSAKPVLREIKAVESPRINPPKVRFEPQVTSTPREILKQKDVPLMVNQSADVISEIPLSNIFVSEISQNSQESSNAVSEAVLPTTPTAQGKKQSRSALRNSKENLKCPQKSSNIVEETLCSPVSSKDVVDDWEDDSLFDDSSTPKKTTSETLEQKSSVMDYMKDSASLLDDEKRKLLKSGKPLPPELLPIPASVLLKRMKDEETKQTPMKRKAFNFDSDDERSPDKRLKMTPQSVDKTPTTPVQQNVSPGSSEKPVFSDRFSFDNE
ncbi:hypothetical protein FO519_007203 [Halicephalobus sp. NKZ332]|nr:hypothetical protein FO519_007203 [Halicephalobus sp. NKZ332]